MLLQRVNRTDAEKVFIIVQNTSGGTLGKGCPVYFETAAQSDGIAVSEMASTGQLLFAGILTASLADDGYGLAQVYGINKSTLYCPTRSDWAAAPGSRLVSTANTHYMAFSSGISGQGTAIVSDATLFASIENFVTSMETIAAADGKSATGYMTTFIRAL